mmetsp:Transcript_30226/g.51105  ORF Transcript_30226/g.51105 Transcript_30226/m.51105 type:complete len:206 (+) Transcript_30226:136-753(+)
MVSRQKVSAVRTASLGIDINISLRSSSNQKPSSGCLIFRTHGNITFMEMISMLLSVAAASCKCGQRDPTLPRARGHVYIKDFTKPMPTLTDVLPDTTVWNQNMKNASVPTWMHISDTTYHKLHTVLEPLQEFGIPQATITDYVNNIADTCATQVIIQVTHTDVRVQTKALTRASRALSGSQFRAGVYDKATHCPWVACNVVTASL